MTTSHARHAGQVPYGGNGSGEPSARSLAPTWGRTWQLILFAAVATFVFGLILLVWPQATIVVVAVLLRLAAGGRG